jgi:hypothetical protein
MSFLTRTSQSTLTRNHGPYARSRRADHGGQFGHPTSHGAGPRARGGGGGARGPPWCRVAALFTEIERHLGPIDAVFNNAGISIVAPITDTTDEQWQRLLQPASPVTRSHRHPTARRRLRDRGGPNSETDLTFTARRPTRCPGDRCRSGSRSTSARTAAGRWSGRGRGGGRDLRSHHRACYRFR